MSGPPKAMPKQANGVAIRQSSNSEQDGGNINQHHLRKLGVWAAMAKFLTYHDENSAAVAQVKCPFHKQMPSLAYLSLYVMG